MLARYTQSHKIKSGSISIRVRIGLGVTVFHLAVGVVLIFLSKSALYDQRVDSLKDFFVSSLSLSRDKVLNGDYRSVAESFASGKTISGFKVTGAWFRIIPTDEVVGSTLQASDCTTKTIDQMEINPLLDNGIVLCTRMNDNLEFIIQVEEPERIEILSDKRFRTTVLFLLIMLFSSLLLSTAALKIYASGLARAIGKLLNQASPLNEWDPDLKFVKDEVTNILLENQRLKDGLSKQVKNAAIARATQMIAHDVRKPLSMTRITLDALKRSKTMEEMHGFLKVAVPDIQKSILSVDGLLQDIMEVSAHAEPKKAPISPEALIFNAINEIVPHFPKASISFSFDLKHSRMVSVDPVKVSRVFHNIFGNAFQAMKERGEIKISTCDEDEFVRFSLWNNGPAILPEHFTQLFEAFFTSGKQGGTGLGLAIAQTVVSNHGGRIWCESTEGRGVTFHFTLPRSGDSCSPDISQLPSHTSEVVGKENVDESEQSEAAIERELLEKLAKRDSRVAVLFADDEALYRNSLSAHIYKNTELAWFIEVLSTDGRGCDLEAIQEKDISLAVVDIDFGHNSKNGFTLVSELRLRGMAGTICMHSNRLLLKDQRTAMECGANAFFPKPMSRYNLLSLLLQSLCYKDKENSDFGLKGPWDSI